MDIKYKVNGLLEIIFGCLSDTINSITSFFDYLLIEREFVVVCLLLIMFVIAVPIAVYLWDESKEKETSKSQKNSIFQIFHFDDIVFCSNCFFIHWNFIFLYKLQFDNRNR